VRPWARGGPTDLGNGLSLCWFHHGRHHAGAFRIREEPGEAWVFETADGRPIKGSAQPGSPAALHVPDITWRTPMAGDLGPYQFSWVVDGTTQACVDANARAGP
jgi:hypothetical protein